MIDVGETVGNYKVTAKLGEGGMGMVFLAEHPVIGSKVALKAVHPHFARSPEVLSRFVTEARAVNQIAHDHIVNITDFGTTAAGDFYFIMEYLDGETLSDVIARQGAFLPARALNIAAQIADALHASHEQGVIHRDLKPANIFLITRDTTMDFVKVLDFGLAKLTHGSDATPAHQTSAGMVMGTPYYMSPEQCEGKAGLDHRADIYALGVILFEMVTGRVPFGGEGYGEVIIQHITLPPPTASSLVPGLSPAVDVILSRALSKDPGQRFQTMADFRAALLDPEGYKAPVPRAAAGDDLSLRTRIAPSMARTELTLDVAHVPSALGRSPVSASSTFRQSVGERFGDSVVLKPRRARRRWALVAVAALAVAATSSSRVRHAATVLFGSTVANRAPSTVRVNFSSDPDGAMVYRDDGAVLGATPLSIEVPYSDAPVGYRVSKEGYETKVSSFVPNLPLPIFALLQKTHQAALATAASPAPAEDPPLGSAPSPARAISRAPGRHHHRVATADEDGVLAPSFP